MPIPVIISGTEYQLPVQGDSPPWGDNLDSIIQAMIASLATLNGTGDILNTSFTLVNNQTSPVNVVGLSFDTSTIRSAEVSYSIYRSSNTPNEFSECGTLLLTYKSTAGTWEIAQIDVGSSGVIFTITNAGQIQYTTTDIGNGSYVGKLVFRAKAFTQ